MRLVSFRGGFGKLDEDAVTVMGTDIIAFLERPSEGPEKKVRAADLTLTAPVPNPGKIIAIGLNYKDHARESGLDIPTEPILFGKFANSVIGSGEAVIVPLVTKEVDYEAELGVVMGRRAQAVKPAEALSYVAGYTCVNDVSARDLQQRSTQWTRGKAIDTFLPVGPALVTADEIQDPQSLSIKCLVNNAIMQNSNTDQMIFSVAELISFISQTITLCPGDLIATGTPPGIGSARKPSRFLHDGDIVTVEIELIGRLTNAISFPQSETERRSLLETSEARRMSLSPRTLD
jgi:2-keto-4-pentenoate hydratase/2-oxohepta-3-ene-1,7-dioic acid hydratase in catechol pathway